MTRFQDEADDYTFTLIRPTERAWLVRDADGEEYWLPKSICEWPPARECQPMAVVTVSVPNWFAEKEGLLG